MLLHVSNVGTDGKKLPRDSLRGTVCNYEENFLILGVVECLVEDWETLSGTLLEYSL